MCPASSQCSAERSSGDQCSSGAQGKYEPLICQPGYYCPTPLKMTICPAGYYCPTGTVDPIQCDFISTCPEGSFRQISYVGLLAIGIVDLVLIVLYFVYKMQQQRTRCEPILKVLPTPIQNLFPKLLNSVPVSRDSKVTEKGSATVLVDSFRKGLNNHNLNMNFKFDNMGLTLPNGKTILQGVTGEIRSSRMTAIMGPSGAGKTTFMNVLCGKVSRTSGQLWVSGKEAEISQFKKIIGYVPQEDTMLRELTVRENILHSARIRLPASWTNQEVENHVDDILKALNLSHVAHTRIGDERTRGISGGQRKRVNIGIELAAVPVCIFLDEPTSGLDSTASLEVATILDEIAQLGLTIVSVIHQPRIEIFEKFHDVLMIAPGGRTAYLGPTNEAKPYFEELGYEFDPYMNPADVLMDILSGKGVNQAQKLDADDLVRIWTEKQENTMSEIAETTSIKSSSASVLTAGAKELMVQNENFHNVVPEIAKSRGAPYIKQVWYNHGRSIAQQLALIDGFIIEVSCSLIAGLFIGLSCWNFGEMFVGHYIGELISLGPAKLEFTLPLFFFFVAFGVAAASSTPAVKVFSEERTVYFREAAAGHSKLAYFAGKNLSTIVRMIVSSLHYTALLHVLARPMLSFMNVYLIVLLNFYCVYGLCAIVSMIVEREEATLVGTVASLITAAANGFAPTLAVVSGWGMTWLWDLSFSRWTTEVGVTQSVDVYSTVYRLDSNSLTYGYTLDRVAFDFAMAIVIGVVWRGVAFLLMVGLNKEKQK